MTTKHARRGEAVFISAQVAAEIARRCPTARSVDAALREILEMPSRQGKPSQALARFAAGADK